jgi:hypothetical protein
MSYAETNGGEKFSMLELIAVSMIVFSVCAMSFFSASKNKGFDEMSEPELNHVLDCCVKEERYEDAAFIRDLIKRKKAS